MTVKNIYLARQPIVDAHGELVAFELLFRATDHNAANVDDDYYATSAVVASVFTEIGLDQAIGRGDGYINVDTEFLFSDLVEALPPDRIVLELLESVIADEATIERCQQLRGMGYRIVLDEFVGNFSDFDHLLPSIDAVKIDFKKIDALLVPTIVKLLRRHSVRLIASKVETPEQFAQAKALGIDLFQGFHFARPQVLTTRAARPDKLALLRLLGLALDEADTADIEREFKRHPHLSVNLLRLVNSAAMGRKQSVTSLRHALVLLGRRQLGIWLQLLLYTADRGERKQGSPLLQLAAVRGKLMELLAERQSGTHGAFKELAFITGILSLMDVLLGMSHQDILAELNLPPPVTAALLRHEGEIGVLLSLTEQLEQGDSSAVTASLRRQDGVDASQLIDLQLAAFQWANEVATVD